MNHKTKLWCDIHKWGTHTNDNCKNQLICALCQKNGHKTTKCRTVMCHYCKRINNPKGFIGHKDENCFLLQSCQRCDKKGHETKFCRTILCDHCKFVLKNDNFLGHTEENCFLLYPCGICKRFGHKEEKCLMQFDNNNNQKESDVQKENYHAFAIIYNEDIVQISVPFKEKIVKKKTNNKTIFVIKKKVKTLKNNNDNNNENDSLSSISSSSLGYHHQKDHRNQKSTGDQNQEGTISPSSFSSSISWADSMDLEDDIEHFVHKLRQLNSNERKQIIQRLNHEAITGC